MGSDLPLVDPQLEPRQTGRGGSLAEDWLLYFGGKGWLKMGLVALVAGFTLVGAYQTTHYLYSHAADFWWRFRTAAFHRPAELGGSQSDPGSAAPHIFDHHPVASNRLELKWVPVAGAIKYRVYWHTPDNSYIKPLGQDVNTPGAVVDVSPGWKEGYVSVTAIGAGDIASPHSEKIAFVPNGENYTDSVEPLPPSEKEVTASPNPHPAFGPLLPEGRRPTAVGPLPRGEGRAQLGVRVPAPTLSAPVEVHAEVRTPDLIRLTWRAVGRGYTYNAYSSASRELTALRKENDRPLKSNVVDWMPETGLERYWVVVTAVDAQGHESAYSEAIEVVRHPEKSGSNGVLDAAAGTVRKFMPW